MSTNTIISCNWPSAKALAKDIHIDKLNATDVVKQCANVCELAFESKRNEILGEGIMISSLIQAVLFSTFGVLLPGIVWLLNKRSTADVAPSTILLRKIQTLMLETSGFLITSFFVTAIFTCRQSSNPSIIELTFVSSLVDIQFYYIMSIILSQSADKSMNQTQIPGRLQLYYYALFIVQLVTSSSIKIPHQSVFKTLAKECHKQHQFIDVISSASNKEETAKYVGIGFGISICILVIVVLGVTYITYIPPFLIRPWKMVWNRLPSWLKENAHLIFDFFLIGLYAGIIPLNFYRLEKVRKLVIQTSGAQSVGGENWGYGQTTAILLWFPFFFSAIKETIKYIRNPPQPETSQAKTESSEQEKSLPLSTADVVPPPYDYPHPAFISTATPEVATK